jgi:chemotaxis protein histidine kinase CheA
MSSSVGLLDFFILEASEYLERLDGIVAAAGAGAPDLEAFTGYARRLRGSSTMARLASLSEVAAGIERLGRALRDGALPWDERSRGVLVAAIDDLKILVRAVRMWGSNEERRAQGRAAELIRMVPAASRNLAPTPSAGPGGPQFFITESEEIARTLDIFVVRPTELGSLQAALGRVRALRGIAAIRDYPPLPDVFAAVERAAKTLELGAAAPSAPQLTLFAAAAQLLRRAAGDLRAGTPATAGGFEMQRFIAASAALDESAPSDADRIVPIESLFHPDDGPHLVAAAQTPPTTPGQRFRLEVVSQAEHLRRVVGEARAAFDPASRARLAREMRSALRALGDAARGFGEEGIASFVERVGDAAAALDAAALAEVDEIAALLADPARERDEIGRRVAAAAGHRPPAPSPAAPTMPVGAMPDLSRLTPTLGGIATSQGARPPVPAPAPASAGPRPRSRTPSGDSLKGMLQHGIARIGELHTTPLSEPVPVVDESLVPIDALLYRGRAALDRARAITAEIRAQQVSPSPDTIAELSDLLHLAGTE